jgi:serine/threonine-protein kinase
MEYIEGRNLKDILKDGSPLTINRTLEISENILRALSVMHKVLTIHRDLNPANIMIAEDGRAVLAYLGLTRNILNDTASIVNGSLLGTPKYMAPELFEDKNKVDSRTDIYAFGTILFEILTGKPPFDKKNAAELMKAHQEEHVPDIIENNPKLPGGFKKIIEKAMAKNKEDRYRNADEMLSDLRKIK